MSQKIIICLHCGKEDDYGGDQHNFCVCCGKPIRPNFKGKQTQPEYAYKTYVLPVSKWVFEAHIKSYKDHGWHVTIEEQGKKTFHNVLGVDGTIAAEDRNKKEYEYSVYVRVPMVKEQKDESGGADAGANVS